MKLNLGCGYRKRAGFVNVDFAPECEPDLVCDLESLPWPWEGDSADEILFYHSLEHLGQDTRTFFGIMKELYRVCKDGAQIQIVVPHPRHDDFLNDPTHVRIITPRMMMLFDREYNDEARQGHYSDTPLAHYLGVDFHMESFETTLCEPYASQHKKKQLSDEDVELMLREWNNVASEFRIMLVARKATGR
jgi:predicted SAM-dependent methyltransferase